MPFTILVRSTERQKVPLKKVITSKHQSGRIQISNLPRNRETFYFYSQQILSKLKELYIYIWNILFYFCFTFFNKLTPKPKLRDNLWEILYIKIHELTRKTKGRHHMCEFCEIFQFAFFTEYQGRLSPNLLKKFLQRRYLRHFLTQDRVNKFLRKDRSHFISNRTRTTSGQSRSF